MEAITRTDERGRTLYVQVFNGKEYKLYAGERYFSRGTKRLHREVWKLYNGQIPKGYHVHHKDENTWNNDISNLELVEITHIYGITQKSKVEIMNCLHGEERILPKQANLPLNGTNQRREGNGIAKKQKSNLQMQSRKPSFVNGVEKSSLPFQTEIISFAQTNAKQPIGIIQGLITKRGNANGAAMNLLQTNTARPNFVVGDVADNILQASELKEIEIVKEDICNVYDIEVEDMHEFFANGVLVHNCIDAARYYVLGELLGRIMKPKDISGVFGH